MKTGKIWEMKLRIKGRCVRLQLLNRSRIGCGKRTVMKDRRVCQCVCVCECMRVCMRVAAEVRWGVENVRSSRSVKPVSGAGIFFFGKKCH